MTLIETKKLIDVKECVGHDKQNIEMNNRGGKKFKFSRATYVSIPQLRFLVHFLGLSKQ